MNLARICLFFSHMTWADGRRVKLSNESISISTKRKQSGHFWDNTGTIHIQILTTAFQNFNLKKFKIQNFKFEGIVRHCVLYTLKITSWISILQQKCHLEMQV